MRKILVGSLAILAVIVCSGCASNPVGSNNSTGFERVARYEPVDWTLVRPDTEPSKRLGADLINPELVDLAPARGAGVR